MTKMTTMEANVLEALKQNSLDCSGGDFACAEEVDVRALKMTKQQFGAILTTLQTKRLIQVDVVYVNGGTKVTQVTFD